MLHDECGEPARVVCTPLKAARHAADQPAFKALARRATHRGLYDGRPTACP
jgi:hypothetical protein